MAKQTVDVIGVTCLVFTNILLIMAFAPPYWILSPGEFGRTIRQGLWSRCVDSGDCLWSMNKRYGYQDDLEDWFHATQGLMAVGLGLAIIALIVATLALCCQCKNCNSAALVAGLLVLCFLSVGIAVAVFGVKASKKYDAQMENGLTTVFVFGWSFWLAAASAGMALITSFVYCCSSRQTM